MIADTVPLGELTKVQTGKLDANASSEDGEYPFFTCAREPLKIDHWKYDLDAVLVAGNGDLNVKHYKGKFEAYQRTYILNSLDDQRLDTRYLFHFLDKYVERLREQSIGGIIKYIKLGMLTGAEIPLPPLEEQKRIAAILDQADALRRLRQLALERLDALGHAIFQEMFGDPMAKGERWESAMLGEVSEINPKRSVDLDERQKVTFLPMAAVSELGKISSQEERSFGEVKKGYTSFERGDVLLAKITPCFENGKACPTVDLGHEYGFGSTEFHVIRPLSRITDLFLFYLLWSNKFRKLAKPQMTGSAGQKRVPATLLKELRIQLPPLEDQLRFGDAVRKIWHSRNVAENALNEVEILFSSFQSRAFRGEL